MKINKTNPLHWLYLVLQFSYTLIAVALRTCKLNTPKKSNPKVVVLYGHKLTGNLLALYHYMQKHTQKEFRPIFLSLDPAYHRGLRESGEDSCSATSPRAIGLLASASVIITDHGLHAMTPLLYVADLQLFDVWHGIPFKGFDTRDFRTQHQYDETWVTSPLLKRLYVERFGFREAQVVVTGYARTDRLVNSTETPAAARDALGLPSERKLILFAPTWSQDEDGRSVFPFGVSEDDFLDQLSAFATARQCSILLRPHLNTSLMSGAEWPSVYVRPFALHPDTESLLLAADVLVCDWSSIAFDFLLLERPTIFLDVRPPFRKGFTLGPEYRFGRLVRSMDDLESALTDAVDHPEQFLRVQEDARKSIKLSVYAGSADGQASPRCLQRIKDEPRVKAELSR